MAALNFSFSGTGKKGKENRQKYNQQNWKKIKYKELAINLSKSMFKTKKNSF
jgi:hypothetical protein